MIIERILDSPITINEFKDCMKIDYETDDEIIKRYIWTAIEICERESGNILVKSMCKHSALIPANKKIILPEFPATKIVSIQIEKGGNIVNLNPNSGFISENKNFVLLMENTPSESMITIQYEGGIEKVPMFVITAIKIIASNLYDNKNYRDNDLGELLHLLRTLNTTALV